MLKIYIISIFIEKIIVFSRYFTYIFITLSVAEARIRISLLTLLIRTHGEDNILLINILKKLQILKLNDYGHATIKTSEPYT